MPEGDTVRRTAAGLHEALAGRDLQRVDLRWGELGGVDLAGRTVTEVTAYGKHILTRIGPGAAPGLSAAPAVPLTLRSHLRMDGAWTIYRTGSRRWPPPDSFVRAVLESREWTAVGEQLGMLDLVPTADEARLLGDLGPDVMADDFPEHGLPIAVASLAAPPDRPVGAALLDQRCVAGIGTLYMAETLFLQGISPWQAVGEVDLAAVLLRARHLLLRGVRQPMPNTTGDPRRGQGHYVHARSGRPCRRCGTTVRVAGVGVAPRERPAFYCATCQPGPAPTDDGRFQGPLGSGPPDPSGRRLQGLRQRW